MADGMNKNMTVRFISDLSKWKASVVRDDINSLMSAEKKTTAALKKIDSAAKETAINVGEKEKPKSLLGSFFGATTASDFFKSAAFRLVGGLTAIGVASAIAKKGLSSIIQSGIKAEGTIASLTVLLGSETAALKNYAMAIELSRKVPFDESSIVAASALAAQFGMRDAFAKTMVGANNTKVSVMEIVAGMASFRDEEGHMLGMQHATTALLRGNMFMLKNFRGLLLPAYNEAKKIAQPGTVMFSQEFISRVAKIPEFMKMAAIQSQTVESYWNKIKNSSSMIATYFSGVTEGRQAHTFWNTLREMLEGISKAADSSVEHNKTLLMTLGDTTALLFKTSYQMMRNLWMIAGPAMKFVWDVVAYGIIAIITPINWILRAIIYTGEKAIVISKALWDVTEKLLGLNVSLEKVSNWTGNVFLKIQEMGVFIKSTFDGLIDSIVEFITRLPELLTSPMDRVSKGVKGFLGIRDKSVPLTKAEEDKIEIDYRERIKNVPQASLMPGQSNYNQNNQRTNIYNYGAPRQSVPDWIMRNPFDLTGRPSVGVA